jgi:hypothetical protein
MNVLEVDPVSPMSVLIHERFLPKPSNSVAKGEVAHICGTWFKVQR